MKKKRQTVFRLGLERVRELCRRLGDPQNSMCFVHVAGTNGKGSASVMLYEVLTGAGYVTPVSTLLRSLCGKMKKYAQPAGRSPTGNLLPCGRP